MTAQSARDMMFGVSLKLFLLKQNKSLGQWFRMGCSVQADVAVLDEIDSGLDIDALRDVADAVNGLKRPDSATLMVTHYKARPLLKYFLLFPDGGKQMHTLVYLSVTKSKNWVLVPKGAPERLHLMATHYKARPLAFSMAMSNPFWDRVCSHSL